VKIDQQRTVERRFLSTLCLLSGAKLEVIVLRENFSVWLIRNDLDWRDIGTHKVAALARRMQLVNPSVKTQTRQSRMAGQESSETAETLLNMMTDCDLILDATAGLSRLATFKRPARALA
jgi:nucleotide-binding universal stress UspA family protein